MGSQTELDLGKRDRDLGAIRDHGLACDLEGSDVQLIVALADLDRNRTGETTCRKSLHALGKLIGRDHKTVARSLSRLEAAGCLVYESTRVGQLILVDWHAYFSMQPAAAEIDRLRARRKSRGEGVGRGGEAPAPRVQEKTKPRGVVSSPDVVSTRGAGPPQAAPGGSGERREDGGLPGKPWSSSGLTDDQLVGAVEMRDKRLLLGLYWAGVEASFYADCEQLRAAFLAACHCAARRGRKPMRFLVWLGKRGFGTAMFAGEKDPLSQQDEDWATQTRKVWRRVRQGVVTE